MTRQAHGVGADEARFGTVLRAASVFWRAGCWFRATCVAGMRTVVLTVYPDKLLRATMRLIGASAAVATKRLRSFRTAESAAAGYATD